MVGVAFSSFAETFDIPEKGIELNGLWGSMFGILPAIHLIYIGTKETGQIINEIPIGIIVLVFYIVCGGFVFYKSKKLIN